MLEININFRLNNTVVASLFHAQKIKNMHAIQQSTQKFLANDLEKTHKGKTSQRERFLASENLQQNLEIFRPTYLNLEEKISASCSVPNRKN